MESIKPNVFIINIHPENWEGCIKDHRFGIRIDISRPKFSKGDIFLVRRTGKEYGVMGIWLFSKEEYITDQTEVPWDDYEYRWQQWFEPIVDFESPVSEEFAGASKFSSKIQISAMRLAGSVVSPTGPEIVRYLEAILKEKAEELLGTVDYEDKPTSVAEVLNGLLTFYKEKKVALPPPIKKKQRDLVRDIVGEPIKFRGIMYAPLNEEGVVLLFSKVMNDLGIIYESSPPAGTGFDMVGREQTDKGYMRRHIEFEYKSSNFKAHGHDPAIVDYIVCWEHDWVDCPEDLQVIELRQIIRDLPAEFK